LTEAGCLQFESYSFIPPIKLTEEKRIQKKIPSANLRFLTKKLMKIHTARLSYVQQLIFVTFDMPFYHHVKAMPSSTASLDLVVFLPVILL